MSYPKWDYHMACECPEKKKPVESRNWVVMQRECNHSAFNGYRRTPSDYSEVKCLSCGKRWRTKGRYVLGLRDRPMVPKYAR